MLRSGLTSTVSQFLQPTANFMTTNYAWRKCMPSLMFSFCTSSISPALHGQKHLLLSHHIKLEKTIQILNKKGIKQLFPIQAKTYQSIMEGKDVIAGDKTGSGKTIAFSLPVIERMRAAKQFNNLPGSEKGIKFLIMAPTRELALQITTELISLKHYGSQYRVMTAYGGIPVSIHRSELERNPDIVVGTPGRVNDLINRGYMRLNQVKVVCIDEADYMFDIGFHEQIKKILDTAKTNSKYEFQLLCFSATLNKMVNELTKNYMRDDKVMIKENNDHLHVPSTISHRYLEVQNNQNKTRALIELLKQLQKKDPQQNGHKKKRIIIFTGTKSQADELSLRLDSKQSNGNNTNYNDEQKVNFRSVVLHGDIDQRVRIARLQQFRDNQVSILIASDVAARGLDLPNVDVVINYDMTKNVESYVHRAGRTGRAGKSGLCISLISVTNQTDGRVLGQIVKTAKIKLKKYKPGNQEQSAEQVEEQKFATNKSPVQELIMFDRYNYLSMGMLQQELSLLQIDTSSLKEKKSRKDNSTFFTITPKDFEQQQKILEMSFGQKNNKFRVSGPSKQRNPQRSSSIEGEQSYNKRSPRTSSFLNKRPQSQGSNERHHRQRQDINDE